MKPKNPTNGLRDLVESGDFLRSLLENMADGIVIADQKVIVHINHALSEMLGYSPQEVIGKPTTTFRPPEQAATSSSRVQSIFEELIEKGKVRILHDIYQTKDGRLIPVDVNISHLRDQDGRFIGSVAVIRDISQREKIERELKESEERFRNLVEMANDGIVMVDGERKIILFNRKAEEIYGYKREEIIGKEVSILIPRSLWKKERKWYDLLLKTGSSPVMDKAVELEGLHKDGSEIPLEYSFSMLKEGSGTFSIAVVRDITERKKLEQERVEKEKLSALMELAGATAHELNQPLTTILGATEILIRKASEKDPQLKQLSLIAKETQRLSSMIKKIRKVIRYETKPYLDDLRIIDLDKASKKKKP
ncbi:MAG TPA: PAS domain S-box protein [Thermodesulfobacteriota bacterium]|nr:PAS domain S-box protein [Thermodesulfobacteriota bacterium]